MSKQFISKILIAILFTATLSSVSIEKALAFNCHEFRSDTMASSNAPESTFCTTYSLTYDSISVSPKSIKAPIGVGVLVPFSVKIGLTFVSADEFIGLSLNPMQINSKGMLLSQDPILDCNVKQPILSPTSQNDTAYQFEGTLYMNRGCKAGTLFFQASVMFKNQSGTTTFSAIANGETLLGNRLQVVGANQTVSKSNSKKIQATPNKSTSPGSSTSIPACSSTINSKLLDLVLAVQSWNDAIRTATPIVKEDLDKLASIQTGNLQYFDSRGIIQNELNHFQSQITTGQMYVKKYESLYDTLTKNCITRVPRP